MENTKIVKELYKAFGNHDIDKVLSMLSPDVVWQEPNSPLNPCGGTRYGHAGFLEWLNIGRQAEDILVLEPKQYIAQNDTVVVIGFTKCLAKPTSKTYETDFVHIVTVKDGKVSHFQEFFDTYAAAEAFRSNQ